MDENEKKGSLQKTFNDASLDYDCNELRFFAASSHYLTSLLKLSGEEKVLDVATGTGYTALECAKLLTCGEVIGIDFSSGMLAKAEEKMHAQQVKNVRFIQMDMESLEFPDNHFDIAICSYGIFFVEDMDGLLKNMVKKVKAGGKVLVSTFTDNSFLPPADLFIDRLRKYGLDIPPMHSKQVGTGEQCTQLFQIAGLTGIRVVEKEFGYYLRDSQDWWNLVLGAAFRGFVTQLSSENKEQFKEEHFGEIETLATDKGIWLEVNALFTLGTKVG